MGHGLYGGKTVEKVEFEAIKEQINTSGISKTLAKYENPIIVSGIPENLQDSFHKHGFAEYAVFQDYWIDALIPPGEQYNDYVFLHNDECVAASEISITCRGKSRGFEGGTPGWFSNWLHGEEGLQNSAILIYKSNGHIAGFSCTATYAHDSEKGAVVWVRMMAVHPNYQGRGIGAKLLMQTLQYGAEHGAKRAFLHTDTQNTAAIKIYLNAGFQPREDEKQIDMIRSDKQMSIIKTHDVSLCGISASHTNGG